MVGQVIGDVPAGAIKVELVRCGAVVEDDLGTLTAQRRHVVPEAFDEKLISAMSFGLRGLASTIAHNSDPGRMGDTRIERVVHSDPIPAELRTLLRERLRRRIAAFTEEVDDLFAEGQPLSEANVAGLSRVGVGVYYYEDEE